MGFLGTIQVYIVHIHLCCKEILKFENDQFLVFWVFCSTMMYATKGAPSECQQHWPGYGGEIYRNTQFNRL